MITKIANKKGGQYVCLGGESERLCPRNEFYGLSTDTLPTEGVNNADIFYAMDTGAVFLYDEENGQWLEQ